MASFLCQGFEVERYRWMLQSFHCSLLNGAHSKASNPVRYSRTNKWLVAAMCLSCSQYVCMCERGTERERSSSVRAEAFYLQLYCMCLPEAHSGQDALWDRFLLRCCSLGHSQTSRTDMI